MEIWKKLKMARELRGLSLRQAADRTGIHFQSIYQYEIGKHTPNMNNAIKLAKAYQISFDDIFCSKT